MKSLSVIARKSARIFVAIHKQQLQYATNRPKPRIHFLKMDSRNTFLLVQILWITKEATAAPCFMDCHALRCKARNDGKRAFLKKWILGLK